MNRPILHLKKKPAPQPTVVAVTVSGAKPATTPTPPATGLPLRENPDVLTSVDTSPPEPHPVVIGGADTTDTRNTTDAPTLTLSDLLTRFPVCFNFEHTRPLKIGIHRDLVALGHPIKAVRTILSRYCSRPSYRRALVVDAVRVGLDGGDAGRVTAAEVEGAKQVGGFGRPVPAAKAPAQAANDVKLEGESVVNGKIEMVCKFSELPKAVQVQGGYRFGVEQDGVRVVVTLNAKAWRKVEAAARDWPSWIAAVSGKVGAVLEGGKVIELVGANVQCFEKKQKEAA